MTCDVSISQNGNLVPRRGCDILLSQCRQEVTSKGIWADIGVRDFFSFNCSSDFYLFIKKANHWLNCIVTVHINPEFRWEEPLMTEETEINNNMSDSRFCKTRHYGCTLMFPASLIAAISFTWSSICCPPTVDITTSTSFNAFTRLSWSFRSPCTITHRDFYQNLKH